MVVLNLDPNAPYGADTKPNTPLMRFLKPNAPFVVVSVAGGEEVTVVEVMTWCRGCGGGWWVWRGVDDDDDGGDVAVDGVEVVEVVWMRSGGGMADGRWLENGRSGAGLLERRGVEGDKEGEEFEEEEGDDLEYYDTFPFREELEYREWVLKNSRPSWVRAKIRKGSLDNIKIPCMIGYFLKEQTYIDPESPVNIMSKLYYYSIISEGLKSREKPSNPRKTCNFVGRVRGLKVFVGNFTYECDFMVLEDVSSVTDHYLGKMVLGKPFVKQSKLTYDDSRFMSFFLRY
nr:protein kinase-like domain, concanavalin A-like lectin/glucanase domain protein [Tanacetum cinerariifolium]